MPKCVITNHFSSIYSLFISKIKIQTLQSSDTAFFNIIYMILLKKEHRQETDFYLFTRLLECLYN
jgi:hypothetical protein